MVDFKAYYCASLAQREGNDPYAVQPLHACEGAETAPYYRAPANVTVPAPYPPYALAFFYPFTLLPFAAAAALWWIALAAAVFVAAYVLARLAGTPALAGWAALVLSLGLTSFAAGNAMPLALAAILVAALCARKERFVAAAAATALAMIEPQVALPAAAGLFVALPRMRLALAAAFGLLAALSLAAGGLAQSLAYVTAVLPAHALSEVSRDNQYSLSTVAAALGLSDSAAVLAGSVSYALVSVAGVLAGLRLAARYQDAALTALVPAGFSLLGGSFVHTAEIAAAVPACLVLFARAAAPYRPWFFAALLLLAVPWILATSAAMFLAPLFPIAYLTYELYKRDRALAMATALASFVVIVLLFRLSLPSTAHAVAAIRTHPAIDPRLAEASWRNFVLGNSTNRPVMWLLRLPTWAGLLAFAVSAIAFARKTVAAPTPAEGRFAESRA